MNLASHVAGPPTQNPIRSLRQGMPPAAVSLRRIDQQAVAKALADPELVHPQGTTAIITPDSADPTLLTTPRAVAVKATDAKGLEFDTVIVIEPADFLDAGEFGRRQLYVALTRPTQRLVVLHSRPLPPSFDGLVQRHRLGDGGP
jgi:hypothetical protein